MKKFILAHKVLTSIAALLLIFALYRTYKVFHPTVTETRYVLANVTKGTIVSSVSGTGSVSVTNQIDVKPKVSGTITYVNVREGQYVGQGAVIAGVDSTDAEKAVRDAELDLQSAQLSLEKLSGSSVVPRNKEQAQADLDKAYADGFNSVADTYLDLPDIISGVEDSLYAYNFSHSVSNADYLQNVIRKYDEQVTNFHDDAIAKYQAARASYEAALKTYKDTSRSDAPTAIENLINQTYSVTQDIADGIKSSTSLYQFYEDRLNDQGIKPEAQADVNIATLGTYTSKINTHLAALRSIQNTISDDKNSIDNADLDVQSLQLTVKQRENALADAKDKLADYTIRAPFAGTIALLGAKKALDISPATTIATMITNEKVVEISLNEVDAASVKLGDKVTLTFDAVPNLSLTGRVISIDTLGTVSQGVVTYTIKISFDTTDPRVKAGMSVSAEIVTNVKSDVLVLPSSAVKTQGNNSYVEVFNPPLPADSTGAGVLSAVAPERVVVTTGVSNDTQVEIVSGLAEGDQVVARTIQATQAATQAPSLFGGGVRTGGGGGVRIGAGAGR